MVIYVGIYIHIYIYTYTKELLMPLPDPIQGPLLETEGALNLCPEVQGAIYHHDDFHMATVNIMTVGPYQGWT